MFTDDDLKRLKGKLPSEEHFYEYKLEVSTGDIRTLLARLEAAERLCQVHQSYCHRNELLEAWRKACGK